MKLEKYFKDGYVLSPFYPPYECNLRSYNKVKTLTLKEDEIKELLVSSSRKRQEVLYSQDEVVLIKYESSYHITPLDLVEAFNSELKEDSDNIYGNLKWWANFLLTKTNQGVVFLPHLNNQYYLDHVSDVEDYLFKNDDHIVSFIVYLINNTLRERKIKETLVSYIDFIKDVLEQRNHSEEETKYKNNTYSLILEAIQTAEWPGGYKISKNCLDFYRQHVESLASSGEPRAMEYLGYDYYEGTNGYPIDMHQSLYWFTKCFDLTGNPDIARTIGYIYYYGRTTGGVTEGDKAFQYFAIGHLAGKNPEATYKLADCYLKGYGTPVSHQAAYNLVHDLYQDLYTPFKYGYSSKFADVALRMGSFYKDGIYVDKNLKVAHRYYLLARLAIKERLEMMEYVGDRSVALAIYRNIESIEKELGNKPRVIKDGGYLVNGLEYTSECMDYEIKLKDGNIMLAISLREDTQDESILNTIENIGFVERCYRVSFKLVPYLKDDPSNEEFVKAVSSRMIDGITLSGNRIYVELRLDDGTSMDAFTTYSELIFYPESLEGLSHQYTIVSVEFYPGSKTYDYLCSKKDVKVGDKLLTHSGRQTKEVTVKAIKYLYEDQLPLPLEKMGRI